MLFYFTQASMVHSLLSAYDLEKEFAIVKPEPATEDDLRLFHSSEYVGYLKTQSDEGGMPPVGVDLINQSNDQDEDDESNSDDDEEEFHHEYGIGNKYIDSSNTTSIILSTFSNYLYIKNRYT